MLKKLSLRNFRVFDEVEIEFAPLTILLGDSGSGKSSILHALVLLKQSAMGGDYMVPLSFSGPLINLTSVRCVSRFGRMPLGFELHWDNGDGIAFRVEKELRVDYRTFTFWHGGKRYTLENGEPVEPWFFSFRYLPRATADSGHREKFSALNAVNVTLSTFLGKMRYIGTSRNIPRLITLEAAPEGVGVDAFYLAPFLYRRPDVIRRINDSLQKHGKAVGILKSAGMIGVTLKDRNRAFNLVDSGTTYLYTIPILAELYGSPEGGMIMIEHPERHSVVALTSTIDGIMWAIENNKSVLVETQSEALVANICAQIGGQGSEEKVAIYYVGRLDGSGGAFVQRQKV